MLKLKLQYFRHLIKKWFIRKDPDVGKDWRQGEGTTEDEMVGWHNWFNGHEFEQAPGDGEGQVSLACCSPWSHRESEMTEWLNKIQKGQNPAAISEVLEAKVGDCTWSLHTKGVARPPKPPLQPTYRPLTLFHLRDRLTPLSWPISGRQQGHLLLVLTPWCCSRSPSLNFSSGLLWISLD